MTRKRSFTLIELIISIVLLGVIVLGIASSQTFTTYRFMQDKSRAILYQNTSFALETILKAVRGASSIDLATTNHLKLGNTDSLKVSDYYFDTTSKNLCYIIGSQPAKVLLRGVQSFTPVPVPSGSTSPRGVKITLKAKDPGNTNSATSMLESAEYCRIFSAGTYLIRVIHHSGAPPNFFNTISEAIIADTTLDNDEIDVSSNNKTPYNDETSPGMIVAGKSLTLLGGYDNINWNRHPPFTGTINYSAIDPNYETIIYRGIAIAAANNTNIIIDGFTILNASGVGVNISQCTNHSNVTINNNNIENAPGSGIIALDCSYSSSIIISNNIIQGNTSNGIVGGGIALLLGYSPNPCYIFNNTIKNNLNTASLPPYSNGGIYVTGGSAGSSLTISNNNITGNQGNQGGGIYINGAISGSGITIKITNNIIQGNMCIPSTRPIGALTPQGGGIFATGCSTLSITNNKILNNNLTDSPQPGSNWAGLGGGICVAHYPGTIPISNNIIEGNAINCDLGGMGAGIYTPAAAIITNNIINVNSIDSPIINSNASSWGGGIFGGTSIINNLIYGNYLNTINNNWGGGIFSGSSIMNNTVTGNIIQGSPLANSFGPGICGGGTVTNSIVYGNEFGNFSGHAYPNDNAGDIYSLNPESQQLIMFDVHYSVPWTTVLYSDVYYSHEAILTQFQNGHDIYDPFGDPYINQNPYFVTIGSEPYHLGVGSPCINAGNLSSQYNDNDGSRNDMGAYGGPGGTPNPIGTYTKADDTNTTYIREDYIGTTY